MTNSYLLIAITELLLSSIFCMQSLPHSFDFFYFYKGMWKIAFNILVYCSLFLVFMYQTTLIVFNILMKNWNRELLEFKKVLFIVNGILISKQLWGMLLNITYFFTCKYYSWFMVAEVITFYVIGRETFQDSLERIFFTSTHKSQSSEPLETSFSNLTDTGTTAHLVTDVGPQMLSLPPSFVSTPVSTQHGRKYPQSLQKLDYDTGSSITLFSPSQASTPKIDANFQFPRLPESKSGRQFGLQMVAEDGAVHSQTNVNPYNSSYPQILAKEDLSEETSYVLKSPIWQSPENSTDVNHCGVQTPNNSNKIIYQSSQPATDTVPKLLSFKRFLENNPSNMTNGVNAKKLKSEEKFKPLRFGSSRLYDWVNRKYGDSMNSSSKMYFTGILEYVLAELSETSACCAIERADSKNDNTNALSATDRDLIEAILSDGEFIDLIFEIGYVEN